MIYGLTRPLKHRSIPLNDIEPYVENVFVRMQEGSVVNMKCLNQSPLFFQFSSYKKDDEIFLEFGFPKVEWSREFYPKVKSKFDDKNISYKLEPQNFKGVGVEEFLTVYDIGNVKSAINLIKSSCAGIGIESPVFTISYDGAIDPSCGMNHKGLPFILKSEMVGYAFGRLFRKLLNQK